MYVLLYVVFFKKKTAYEMRISDWSSDVCSSDLRIDLPAPVSPVSAERPGRNSRSSRSISTTSRMARLTSMAVRPASAPGAATRVLEHVAQPGALLFLGLQVFAARSEEHTSELQSLMRNSYAVLCLTKK